MPVTILDLVVIGVVLISALLAAVRGLTREVLAIASWAAAAVVAWIFHPQLLPLAQQHIPNKTVALVAVIAALFLGTLIIVSLITARISDFVLDSRIGALDRTLGFLFGLGRGLLIVVVAFLFFAWLVPDKQQPDWVRTAKSLSVLQSTGNWLMSLLPDDPETTILKRLKRDKDEQTDASPERPANAAVASDTDGYSKNQREGLRQLIEGKPMTGR